MARLAWASCAVVLALSCGGSDYTPFFGGEGGAGGSAGNSSSNSGGQPGSGGSSAGGSSMVGSGGGMNGAGGSTGTAGMTGSGGMMGAGGKGGSGGSSAGGAGSTGMPDSGAAGAGGMAGTPDAGMSGCTSNDTCPDTSYCKKTSCASDVRGTCTPKPKACMDDAEETPVCGCDGVTYFSSCLAELSGENVSLHGICGDGVGLKCTNANPACVNLPTGFAATSSLRLQAAPPVEAYRPLAGAGSSPTTAPRMRIASTAATAATSSAGAPARR
jgi:hypothetical protein